MAFGAAQGGAGQQGQGRSNIAAQVLCPSPCVLQGGGERERGKEGEREKGKEVEKEKEREGGGRKGERERGREGK